jgi:hypothetical protein
MPLRGPRFSGDPVLEACFESQHRMMAPEEGLPVKRVQAALIELGRSVGPLGADGIFGPSTGAAVSDYKFDKRLDPTDPVVGPGTSKALDDDLFFDPPILDPAFREFSPAVVDHRLEPFVALELANFISAPLNSWRRMLALFALQNFNSGRLLGIVANSRVEDLRTPFLAVAAPTQTGGLSADDFFTNETAPGFRPLGETVEFTAQNGDIRGFIVIRDDVILGRAATFQSGTNLKAPETVATVLLHELTHLRNLAVTRALFLTSDTDVTAYADTALARALSATVFPTANVFASFVDEICARHIEWNVRQEVEGNPTAIVLLKPEELAQAAIFYFVRQANAAFPDNGYVAGINAQGDAKRFAQLDLWLQRCATLSFSDDPAEEGRTKALFTAAAASCADQILHPLDDLPETLGLSPLPNDFR